MLQTWEIVMDYGQVCHGFFCAALTIHGSRDASSPDRGDRAMQPHINHHMCM